MKKILILVIIFALGSCAKKSEPRKPISHSSGSFMKESVDRNKKMNASEEITLKSIIQKDTLNKYINSEKGYWYTVLEKGKDSITTAVKGDLVFFEYEVHDVTGKTIYSLDEIGPQKYLVDKETIIKGFQDGLKKIHKGDKVKFLFPSTLAYGYNGDMEKITGNQPIMCIVKLKEIKKQTN